VTVPRATRPAVAKRVQPGRLAQAETSPNESRRLISAAPIAVLLEQWRSHLSVLELHAPQSDVLLSLATCTAQLANALEASSQTPVDIALADAQALSPMSLRQLQRICQTEPERVGARRYGRKWYLDSVKFQKYIATYQAHDDTGSLRR
jgi:hypothetical protein